MLVDSPHVIELKRLWKFYMELLYNSLSKFAKTFEMKKAWPSGTLISRPSAAKIGIVYTSLGLNRAHICLNWYLMTIQLLMGAIRNYAFVTDSID